MRGLGLWTVGGRGGVGVYQREYVLIMVLKRICVRGLLLLGTFSRLSFVHCIRASHTSMRMGCLCWLLVEQSFTYVAAWWEASYLYTWV